MKRGRKKKYFTDLDYRLMRILASIKTRCYNPRCKGFYLYGGRGIKNNLTFEDLRFLWNRDKADQLVRPSIDRIDNDGDYQLSNCRFIEFRENTARSRFQYPEEIRTLGDISLIDNSLEYWRRHKLQREYREKKGFEWKIGKGVVRKR